MSAFTTWLVRISKTNTKSLTVGKKSARNLIYLVSSWILFESKTDWSWRCRRFRTKRRNKFASSKISSSMYAMLFALTFPQAQHASTFNISAERNVWLHSALRSFAIAAIIWKQLSLRSSAIRDRLRSFAIIWKPALILKVWYVCQIIRIAGDVQRQNKLWARHLIASGRFIRVSVVNDTLPPDFSVKFLWLTWKSPHYFPGKLIKSNFVAFLVLVGLDFS